MTRINLVDPSELTDQHLIAELKEINQLAGQFKKSLNGRRGIFDIPSSFRLGKGHVKFFYDKGLYLHKRFNDIRLEAICRGFDVVAEFNNTFPDKYYNDWEPGVGDYSIIIERITKRILQKKNYYKYCGVNIDTEKYIEKLKNCA